MKPGEPSNKVIWPRDLAYLLYDCSRLLRRRFDERISDFDLREAQWRVISLLSHSEGLTQTELAALIGIQKAPLGEHLDRLESKGWVERRRDIADRRANYIYIREQQKPQTEEIDQRFMQLIDELQLNTSPVKWQAMQNSLAKLVDGFVSDESKNALSRVSLTSSLVLIGMLSRQLSKQFDGALKQLGTTRSQWLVLSVLDREPGICQTELAQQLDMAKAPLGKVIEQLVKKKWLTREQNKSDKRQKHLSVAKGAELTIARAAQDYQKLHHSLSAHLKPKELKSLEQSLQQLQQTLLSLPRTEQISPSPSVQQRITLGSL